MSNFRKTEKRGQFWTVTKICKTFLFGLSKRSLVKIPIFFLVKIISYAIFRSAEKKWGQFWTNTLWIPLKKGNWVFYSKKIVPIYTPNKHNSIR